MAYRLYGAFIGPLSVAVLMLGVNDTFAQVAHAAPRGAVASTHSFPHPPAGGIRRGDPGGFWPGGYLYGPSSSPSDSEPTSTDINQTIKGDIRYTYSRDVPWDWPHRFPPMVAPSDRPYVQSCAAEAVTVPGRNGKERTVNITRCY